MWKSKISLSTSELLKLRDSQSTEDRRASLSSSPGEDPSPSSSSKHISSSLSPHSSPLSAPLHPSHPPHLSHPLHLSNGELQPPPASNSASGHFEKWTGQGPSSVK
ncbi:UNVERIFIED_CONTAM: hypothetical protein Slati_0135200 [Sesamum latifolium]|uniref:Uncharacterized protein n=1 Tax=Sesamum latifolium TaxID=2727402 RepID=A0AAW2Y9E7_9LAMI